MTRRERHLCETLVQLQVAVMALLCNLRVNARYLACENVQKYHRPFVTSSLRFSFITEVTLHLSFRTIQQAASLTDFATAYPLATCIPLIPVTIYIHVSKQSSLGAVLEEYRLLIR